MQKMDTSRPRARIAWFAFLGLASAASAGAFAVITGFNPATPSTRYETDPGLGGDLSFECRLQPAEGAVAEAGTHYLRLRPQVPDYLLADDAAFLKPTWVLSKYGESFWRAIEGGRGVDMCLDHVSTDADGQPLPPYCALSFNLRTQELKERKLLPDAGAPASTKVARLTRVGLCRALDAK